MRKNLAHINCRECMARHDSIFSGLNESQVDEVSRHKSCVIFRKKMAIFNQGTMPHGIYTVNAGKVKIYRLTDSGREQIVRLARKGDVLGYRALITGENYSCTAEAIEDSSICFIPKAVFLEMIETDSNISSQLMRLLSRDLRHAESRMTGMVEKPVRERLAESLLFLKERYGVEADNQTLNVILTRAEIANIAGTSTETAIRLLSEFKDDRLVEFTGKKIALVNLQGLQGLANIFD